jgi:hypothetical protein
VFFEAELLGMRIPADAEGAPARGRALLCERELTECRSLASWLIKDVRSS